jgi:hypothetical protein
MNERDKLVRDINEHMREPRFAALPLSFWTWLRDYCERKMRDYHAASWKCPHCLRWTHTVGGAALLTDNTDGTCTMLCAQCNNLSQWRIEGPVAFHISGKPQEGRP